MTVDALTPSSVKLLGVRDDAQNYVNILFDKEVEAVTSVYAALPNAFTPFGILFGVQGGMTQILSKEAELLDEAFLQVGLELPVILFGRVGKADIHASSK